MPLTQLPAETLHNIFSLVEPEDLRPIAQTCRFLNDYVRDNNALCRDIYLRILDTPPTRDLNFVQELHDLVRLKTLCSPDQLGYDGDDNFPEIAEAQRQTHLPFVHSTVTRLLRHAATAPVPAPVLASVQSLSKSSAGSSANTTSCSNGGSSVVGSGNGSTTAKHLTPTKHARPTRSQTYPVSRNTALLRDLFASRAAREAYLSGSFLFERRRERVRAELARGFEDDDEEEDEGEEGRERDSTNADADANGGNSAPTQNPQPPRQRSSNSRRLSFVGTTRRLRQPTPPIATHQMSAQLHCLYGCSLATALPAAVPGLLDHRALTTAIRRDGGGLYALACSKVYDLREYHRERNAWGPFMKDDNDGSSSTAGLKVDWEKVEVILIVLGTNIRKKGLETWPIFGNVWGRPFAGSWAGSYIPWWRGRDKGEEKEEGKEEAKERERVELERRDPYGVSGSWLRVVSFLDYSDFFDFNFPNGIALPRDVPRPPLNVGEATRLILVRIRVDKIENPGEGDHPDYPVVHFVGFSRALDGSWDDNADSDLCGSVRMTPEGEVRWTSYSIFDGEARWNSEGVQLGGIRSARGVVGMWFDKDYDPNGPCGPSAFWKVSDRQSKGDDPQVTFLEDLLPIIDDAMGAEGLDGVDDDESVEFGEDVFLDGGVDIGFSLDGDMFGEDFDEEEYWAHYDGEGDEDGHGGHF